MNTLYSILTGTLFFLSYTAIESRSISFESRQHNENTFEISLVITLQPQEWLYKDSLMLSLDNPALTLSPFTSSKDAVTKYDPAFRKNKKVFEDTVTLTMQVTKPSDFHDPAYLHISSITNLEGADEKIFPLTVTQHNGPQPTSIQEKNTHTQVAKAAPQKKQPQEHFSFATFSNYISNLVTTIQSPAMRLLLVFLLGVLLSLTPCIYPMIPITIGVLQAQGSKSLIYNFLLALAYTCGMATTFSLFGLLASCTGPLCGQLLMEPLFIAGLIIILSYLAFSMLGFYDVYVPKFFKGPQKIKGGSLVSSFIFGAASGTIASPCVSPGLVLLLSVVATLNNAFLGFLLLFVFGIGLSTPLLIVGAFSSSLSLLPRAGLWMVEIKKLFGFMIFGMCFYYASYIIPLYILNWFIALFVAAVGIYYLYTSQTLYTSSKTKKFTYLVGILCIATSVVLFFTAYRAVTYGSDDEYEERGSWHTNYEQALAQAQQEGKKLFIDFWATFCPICLAINKTVLTKPTIINKLQELFVLLKVDGSHNGNVPYNTLRTKFSVTGFPTFLIVDPETEAIVAQFGGELYDMPEDELIKKLHTF